VDDLVRRLNIRAVLSGEGGDEVTGAHPHPFPQLADLILGCRWIRFGDLLHRWSVLKKQPIFQSFGRCLRSIAEQFSWVSDYAFPTEDYMTKMVKQSIETMSYHRRKRPHSRWAQPSFYRFTTLFQQVRESLSAADLLSFAAQELRYPLLDRSLVLYLANIPAEQRLRPGQRRSIMRRALRNIVPEAVISQKTKRTGTAHTLPLIAGCAVLTGKSSCDSAREARLYFDLPLLETARSAALHGRVDNVLRLRRALAILDWLLRASNDHFGNRPFLNPIDSSRKGGDIYALRNA
jgi:asparagine synthetase B (glutamine-hydrolysing)